MSTMPRRGSGSAVVIAFGALAISACASSTGGPPASHSGGGTGTGGATSSGSGGSASDGATTPGNTGGAPSNGSGGMTTGNSGGRTTTGGSGPSGSGGAPTPGSGGSTTPTGGVPGTIMRVDLTGKKVLMVIGSPSSPATGDAALRDVLTGKGMVVTLADAETVNPAAATMNVLIGSDTAGSGWPTLYKDLAVPMIVFGNGFDFALGFTPTSSAKGNASTPVQITILDATTPLAAAFSMGTNVSVIGTDRNTQIRWVTPGGAPIRVAGVMGAAATELIVFAYEKGAMMAVGTAAARRVKLGWSVDLVEKDLAIEAFRMMNAAIEWTATAP